MAGELVERNTLIAILCRLTTNPGRDHRSGQEFVVAGSSQETVDALRQAAANLRSDNDRIEALERENATLRAERDEARKAKEAEHQQFLQMGSKYVQKCFDLAKVREAVIEEAAQIADNYLPSTFDAKAIAAAIRNMGGGENG